MEEIHEPIRVFISSKQAEFTQERSALVKAIRKLPLLAPVAAEEWPAERSDPSTRYTADAKRCPIYLGLFGQHYSEPTEREYHSAKENPLREIMIYFKRGAARAPALEALLEKMRSEHVVARFESVDELVRLAERDLWAAVSRMIHRYLEIGQGPPVTHGGSLSPQRRRWEAQRARLADLGMPGVDSPATALDWARRLREMRGADEGAPRASGSH